MLRRITLPLIAFILASTMLIAQESEYDWSDSRLPKGISGLEEGQAGPPSSNWLLDANDDTERFRRLQIYAGGTYEQMWQIGYRYEVIYQAIIDENWQLAALQAKKLRDVFNVALMKRPNRTPNAENMFLDQNWGKFQAALETRDAPKIRASFLVQRRNCMSCHVAEGYSYLNDMPVFRETENFP